MPTRSGLSEDEWVLDQDSLEWTLDESGVIQSETQNGIRDTADNSTINVLGWVIGDGENNGSAVVVGASSDLHVGADGWIAYFGFGVNYGGLATISNEGAIDGRIGGTLVENGGTLENGGTIMGGQFGSYMGSNSDLTNSGVIRGRVNDGIFVNGTLNEIVNEMDGRIIGGAHGIYVDQGASARIVNAGFINGLVQAAAIECHDGGQVNVVNTGTIDGDIVLGDIGNTVDNRKGTITGAIYGGAGDDHYLISSSAVDIRDTGASFGDWVGSSASYALTGGLDDLVLMGKKDVNGSGNIGDNELTGNKGDNTLLGFLGNDTLHGGKGRDVLAGGAGVDEFHFNKGDGADRITDIELTDYIVSDYVETLKDFNRLDIRQAGQNTVIDFGHGDKLTIVGVDRDDLSFDMFAA